ncbi:MAG: hypothetical protein OXN17_02270 [Candidatus Poribacteria bacterium]|nr:hypothetical protein [Candidatus Poribacteria bacterium]
MIKITMQFDAFSRHAFGDVKNLTPSDDMTMVTILWRQPLIELLIP